MVGYGTLVRTVGAVIAAMAGGLLLPGTTAAQAAPALSVTLEQALERALAHNPQMVQAKGAIRTAAAAERSAFGSYLPSLSASAGSSLSGSTMLGSDPSIPASGTNDSYNAGLSASWQVYTGGGRGAERAQAEAQTASAEAGLTQQRFGVVFTTQQAYFNVLRAQELIDVAESRIERAQEGLAAAERRMNVGSATRSDVLRAQLELNTARESLLQAQNGFNTAAFQLGRLIGADEAVGATGAPAGPRPIALSPEELAAELSGSAPAVRAAEAAHRAAQASVSASRAQFLPSLNLNSGYNWSNQNAILDAGRLGWQVSLGLSYPLFNGFQREESVERARVQQSHAEAQLQDTRRAIRADVERLLGNLRLAEARIELGEEAVTVAEEDLRVQQDRYRLGASTILDLLTSQTAVVQARTDLVGARHDYQLARAELEALAGRPL